MDYFLGLVVFVFIEASVFPVWVVANSWLKQSDLTLVSGTEFSPL
jgi:hypothetical protein